MHICLCIYPHRKAEVYDFVAYGSEYAGGFVFLLLQQLNYSAWDTSDQYAYIDMMFNHAGAVLGLVILKSSMIIMGIAGLIFFAVSGKKLEWRSGEYERPFHEMAGPCLAIRA